MKRVFFTIVFAVGLVLFIGSCTNDSTDNELYEQGIDNKELKEGDV